MSVNRRVIISPKGLGNPSEEALCSSQEGVGGDTRGKVNDGGGGAFLRAEDTATGDTL